MKEQRTKPHEKTKFRKKLEKECKKCWKSHEEKDVCEKTCAFGHIKKSDENQKE